MIKQHFSIAINAPVQKVWEMMLSDQGYRTRTSVFNPTGSRYEGDRSEGSTIRFLGTDPQNPTKIGGMYSEIKENRLYEYVSIRHLGEIDGDTVKENAVRKGAEENYHFLEKNGVTTVSVDVDTSKEFGDFMIQQRPKGLLILKEICEYQ